MKGERILIDDLNNVKGTRVMESRGRGFDDLEDLTIVYVISMSPSSVQLISFLLAARLKTALLPSQLDFLSHYQQNSSYLAVDAIALHQRSY